MIHAVDVHYDPGGAYARAALVTFADFRSATASEERVTELPGVAEYVPGEFYKRELPPLLAVLGLTATQADIVVIDGYVWLDGQRPGLGARLHDALGGRAVIGVAKTFFHDATLALPVVRGRSERPLYVSAVGVDVGAAAELVRTMHGEHRVPTLLRRVDQLARGLVSSSS